MKITSKLLHTIYAAMIAISLVCACKANATESITWEVEADDSNMIINFNFEKPTASTVFYRGEYLWLVFNHDLPKFDSKALIATKFVSACEQQQQDGFAILRLSPAVANFRVSKTLNGWQLYMSKEKVPDYTYTSLSISSERSLGKATLKGGMPAGILKIQDPVVGDELAIVLYYDEASYSKSQSFIDFNTIAALQGATFSLTSERANLVMSEKLVTINLPSKVEMLPKPVQEILEDQKVGGSILWFDESWRKASDSRFVNDETMLWNQIHELPDTFRGQILWLIAKLYFAHGMHAEAGAVIQLLRKEVSAYASQASIDLTLAVSYYWENNLAEASKEIKSALLRNKLTSEERAEISFWDKMVQISIGALNGKEISFNYNAYPFLKTYPEGLIENLAEKVFNSLLYNPMAGAVQGSEQMQMLLAHRPDIIKNPTIKLYDTIFYALGGNDAALDILNQVYDTSESPKIRALAKFYYLQAATERKKLNIAQALAELEKLQTVWREPSFEVRLLRYYGNLLIQNQEFVKGLRAWRQLVRAFPEQKSNLFLLTEMSRLFVELITTSSEAITAFEKVAVYEEFKELTPVGPEADRVVRKIIDSLVELDLLDRAIELLSHQIQFRLDNKDRSAYVNKLAEVYLANYEPIKALDVLDFYQEQDLPYRLAEERKYLFSQAMIETGRTGYIMELLRHDYSVAGGNIKAKVLWLEGDWKNLRILLEPRILALQTSTVPLTRAQETEILLLSVALSKLGDSEEIKALYKHFYSRIANNKAIAEMIKFLAWQHMPLDYHNLEKSVGIEDIKRLLEHRNEIYKPAHL